MLRSSQLRDGRLPRQSKKEQPPFSKSSARSPVLRVPMTPEASGRELIGSRRAPNPELAQGDGDRRTVLGDGLVFVQRQRSQREHSMRPDGGALSADSSEVLRLDVDERSGCGPSRENLTEAS